LLLCACFVPFLGRSLCRIRTASCTCALLTAVILQSADHLPRNFSAFVMYLPSSGDAAVSWRVRLASPGDRWVGGVNFGKFGPDTLSLTEPLRPLLAVKLDRCGLVDAPLPFRRTVPCQCDVSWCRAMKATGQKQHLRMQYVRFHYITVVRCLSVSLTFSGVWFWFATARMCE
jgi:hypothetical protein